MKYKSVYGIFNSRAFAANAMDELKAAKFNSSDLKILFSPPTPANLEQKTNMFTSLSMGVIVGGLIGATAGWFLGFISVHHLLSGLSEIIIQDPIIMTLIGAGFGGTFGGLVGWKSARAVPVSSKAANHFRSAGFLILADAANSALVEKAQAILRSNHAQDICVTNV